MSSLAFKRKTHHATGREPLDGKRRHPVRFARPTLPDLVSLISELAGKRLCHQVAPMIGIVPWLPKASDTPRVSRGAGLTARRNP